MNEGKILLITSDFYPMVGGQARYLWEIWSRLPADRVKIIAPMVLPEPLCPVPVERVRLPLGRDLFSKVMKTVLLFWAVAGACRKEKPVLVCAGQAAAGGLAAWALHKFYGIPFGLVVHGGDMLGWRAPRSWLLSMLTRARFIIANSSPTAGLVRDIAGEESYSKTVVICPPLPSGFYGVLPSRNEARRKLSIPEKATVILTVARLYPRKGIDMVIESMPDLTRYTRDIMYVVVGDGPEKENLKSLAQKRGLPPGRIRFEGSVSGENLPFYYAAADIFVLVPRRTGADVEGFGIVYLEAQACGLPVVGGRSGGVTDAVKDGETGVLVEPDDILHFKEAVAIFLRDSSKREKTGNAAREWVKETFEPSKLALKFWEAVCR